MTYTKQQVLGYVILGLQAARYPERDIYRIVNKVDWALDQRSPEEAEEHYLSGGVSDVQSSK